VTIGIDYSGKHVFVAGGTSGINFGIAQGFARAGARVAVLSRSQDKVDEAVSRLRDLGTDARGYAADVRDVEAIERSLADSVEHWGPIHVLVSGAAGNFPALAHELSPKGFKTVVDIDLLGSFNVLRTAFAHLGKPGASVINVSAPQAFNAMETQAHVCAAKAGVDMLTRVLAMEWGEHGVRVNSLVPGPIDDTEGMRRLAPTQELKDFIVRTVPQRRLGHVEDLANAALLLCSPLADYITGAIIPVDGGWSLGGDSTASSAMAAEFKRHRAQQNGTGGQ